jgi:hypothetical protein
MKAMKTIGTVAVALATSAGAAAAAGATHEAKGRIEHLNPRAQHLTVGHKTYRYDPRAMGQGLRRGEEVRVVYREAQGHRYAIKILPAA